MKNQRERDAELYRQDEVPSETYRKMTLTEIAHAYFLGSRGFVGRKLLAELARKQAMLDAAEGMAQLVAVLDYHAGCCADPITPKFVADDIDRCREALSAYTAAKETP